MNKLNKIVNLKEYDLVLSYSFGVSERNCTGHIFECIEYFYILKDHFKCCILIGDCVDFENILGNILEKYIFTENEILQIMDSIVIADNPNIVIGKNLLLVDGNYKRLENKMIKFDNYFGFPCGLQNESDYPDYVTMLCDLRIYNFGSKNFIDYKKKMLFSKMKIDDTIKPEFDYMMYLTYGPRYLTNEKIEKIAENYDGSIVIYTDYHISVNNPNITIKMVPVDNLFNFRNYIYTSIERQFDCSPRFIVECALNDRFVIYDLDYQLQDDAGLLYRAYDIVNDIDSIELKSDDSIIKILTSSI